MTSKLHPADIADRQKIATATHFNVHLRRGPTEKINEEAPTLAEAVKIADRISAESGSKPPMIYAITPDKMTVFVPKDLVDAARGDEAMKAPLSNNQIAQLTAILTGGGFKRANSKEAAQVRFVTVAIEKGISADKAADLLAGPFNFAEHILREHVAGKPMTIEQVEAGRQSIEPDAGAAAAGTSAEEAKPPRAGGKRAAILEAARAGTLPEAPDFSAATHARFRDKLAKLVAMAKIGDLDGLRSVAINPVSSSPKAMLRYRDLCVLALEARRI
ncbi:hypothetical protein SAMN05892877_13243 [Rhizobium subbaraonis]|uniref:Uncharacterized protein n=1 Tax=Rhizobium subbaraonis TaxID=908946 RepID=A0A285V2A5_9HYPH|nr:hypothetical protein [Rhizobium subbaraonis]SOC47718.1 hypothetical protein SAMN05892877_13243 [Rhizobium subbaraonis]